MYPNPYTPVLERPLGSTRFFPVLHLMTGPPGLSRNGGIWKRIKADLSRESPTPRLMVQALHFASYGISPRAWEEWFNPWYDTTRIVAELDTTFGPKRDLFLDSGGFQLLHADKIDLSRWKMTLCREDVLALQLRFKPSRIASLDTPIRLQAGRKEVRRSSRLSLENALWLAEQFDHNQSGPRPYLAIHGRDPSEVRRYLARLEARLPRGWLSSNEYGIALGSQVQLARAPETVVRNARQVLAWMERRCPPSTPLHMFGVGDQVVAEISRVAKIIREVSYDNSTYVQNAFRNRIYDATTASYRAFDPGQPITCDCPGCTDLAGLGPRFLSDLMSAPAYRPSFRGGEKVNRSDVLALIALHNLRYWAHRLANAPPFTSDVAPLRVKQLPEPLQDEYVFPLRQFVPRSPSLILLPCSKGRPYASSRSHRSVLDHLGSEGLTEGRDFDRVTLSGRYGPVHWANELDPAILSYDFALGPTVSERHRDALRFRTATVLNVIAKRYRQVATYLDSRPYEDTFGPVARQFTPHTVAQIHDLCPILKLASSQALSDSETVAVCRNPVGSSV